MRCQSGPDQIWPAALGRFRRFTTIMTKPRIAIPVPTRNDLTYNQRSWPEYARAVERAGGVAVEVPLTLSPREIADLINGCQGVLLPGSPADVNPQKYGQE